MPWKMSDKQKTRTWDYLPLICHWLYDIYIYMLIHVHPRFSHCAPASPPSPGFAPFLASTTSTPASWPIDVFFSYWVSSRATKIRVSTGYVHDCIDGTTYNCVYSVSKRNSGSYYICIYSRIYFISIYYLNTYTPTHRFEASVAPKSPKLLPVTHFRYACRQRIQKHGN